MRNGAPGVGDQPSDESSETIIEDQKIFHLFISNHSSGTRNALCALLRTRLPREHHTLVRSDPTMERTSVNCNVTREYSICRG